MTMPVNVNMADTLGKLRRRIRDHVSPYTFSDLELIPLIADAVDWVEVEWTRGFYIDPNTATTSTPYNMLCTPQDSTLFALGAHILFTTSLKEQADRDNFNMSKARLHIDNTNQPKDHEKQLSILNTEYKRLMWNLRTGKQNGGTMGTRIN